VGEHGARLLAVVGIAPPVRREDEVDAHPPAEQDELQGIGRATAERIPEIKAD
jgi:hypothetical protein